MNVEEIFEVPAEDSDGGKIAIGFFPKTKPNKSKRKP